MSKPAAYKSINSSQLQQQSVVDENTREQQDSQCIMPCDVTVTNPHQSVDLSKEDEEWAARVGKELTSIAARTLGEMFGFPVEEGEWDEDGGDE